MLKISLVGICTVTMAGIKEAAVVIYFEMDGVSIEMTGQASIMEKFGKEMTMVYLTLLVHILDSEKKPGQKGKQQKNLGFRKFKCS